VKSGKHVLSRVLSATNEEGRIKERNSIKLATDGIKQINQSSYLEKKADITGDSVNGEDAIDVDDNDVGKLTKSSNASGQVFETIVSDLFTS
jgi:alpha-1,4-galacturonosyltransferase